MLGEVANKLNIPVAVTMHGISSMDSNDPLYLGMVGIHGSYAANSAIHQTDLLIAIGCRLDDRVTLNLKDRFAPDARIVRIDISDGPNPIYGRCKFIHSDASIFLTSLQDYNIRKECWIDKCAYTHELPLPVRMLQKIDEVYYNPERIVVTDVGQNQIWAT
jgi:acetolactate synthase-1/2/3 large subunit